MEEKEIEKEFEKEAERIAGTSRVIEIAKERVVDLCNTIVGADNLQKLLKLDMTREEQMVYSAKIYTKKCFEWFKEKPEADAQALLMAHFIMPLIVLLYDSVLEEGKDER